MDLKTTVPNILPEDVIEGGIDEDFIFHENGDQLSKKSSNTLTSRFRIKPRYGIDPLPAPTFDAFITANKWLGEVREIQNDTILAKVKLLNNDNQQGDVREDYLEFSLDEISPDERYMVLPGAIFSWHIGHARTTYGQIKNQDIIVFHSHPSWTEEYVKKLEEESEDLLKYLNPDNG